MTYADLILPEFEVEMASTRKVLERVPDDKLAWRAHPKANTIGWNANHLAEIPGWLAGTLANLTWDLAPIGGEPYQTPSLATSKEIVAAFDKNVAEAKQALATVADADMDKNWSLLQAGEVLITMPRSGVIRTWVLNHTIHHRAILLVYLKLNNIPVPGMYGPSGDE